MSAIRKVVVSAAMLFLGLSGVFLAAGVASAATTESRAYAIECDDDWQTPCP
ncbi:hypothetical protein [Actinophytocola glycyrrhizae]|uniref:Uncharacterized protein n=1 Tax=Actinophytocola glycyrrhizae TaxID=2044873 RepID=A0ABV9S5R6_9PSEU